MCQVYVWRVHQAQCVGNELVRFWVLMNYFSFLRKHNYFCDRILFRYHFCFNIRETVYLGIGGLCGSC